MISTNHGGILSVKLTILSRVTSDNFGFWSPAVAVPALNFDFVGDKRGRVPHNKGVPFDKMLPPDIFHPQFSVAHLVLKARAIVLNRQQWLQQGR